MLRYDKGKLFLAGGMVAAVLAVPTAFFFTDMSGKIDEKYKLNVKEVETLEVNLNDHVRQVAHKSREEGIKDLRQMVLNHEYEEQLAFEPANNFWAEIGYGSKLVGKYVENVPAVQINAQTLFSLMAKSYELEIYHTHPASAHNTKCMKGVSRAQLKQYQFSNDARPSPRDLANMAHHTILMKKYLKNNKLKECLASYYGVTCYRLTEKGINHFNNMEYQEILDEISSKKIPKFLRSDGVTPEIIKTLSKDPVESSRMCVKDVEDEHIKTEFTPYKEILGDD